MAAAVTAGVAIASVSAAGAAPKAASSGYSYPLVQGIGPRYTTAGGASVLPTTETVTHWHGSFVDGLNGQTYGFNMVGSDPSTGGASTVDTEIVPLDFQFAADGGYGFPGSEAASWVAQSPIFQPTTLPSGETAQYVDAEMRSEFGKIGSSYHLNLANTGILPAQTIVVPQSQGAVYQTAKGVVVGLANLDWFEAQLQTILVDSGISPTTLPIVVSDDVYLYVKSPAACCVFGFHGASKVPGHGGGVIHGNGDEPVLTWAWAAWIPSPDILGPQITDLVAFSHEVAEWAHDPFVDNFVNPWSVPNARQYGCANALETGDPLAGTEFAAGTTNPDPAIGPAWHLQDEAFLWWFERQPTQAANHEYSYLGTFTSGAPGC
jgi:hypothetical protein